MSYSEQEFKQYLANMVFCRQAALAKDMTLRDYLLKERNLDEQLVDQLLAQWKPRLTDAQVKEKLAQVKANAPVVQPVQAPEMTQEEIEAAVRDYYLTVLDACAGGVKGNRLLKIVSKAGFDEETTQLLVANVETTVEEQKKAYKKTRKGQYQLMKKGLGWAGGGAGIAIAFLIMKEYFHLVFFKALMGGLFFIAIGGIKSLWHGMSGWCALPDVVCPKCAHENPVTAHACGSCQTPLYPDIFLKALRE